MPAELPAPETITLRDDATVILRPIRPDDAMRLQSLHSRLSPETIYLRFLGMHLTLSNAEAEQLADVDYQTRMAFVATRGQKGEEVVIGVARYALLGPERPGEAEAAIVIEDRYQDRGLGSILIDRLLAYARAHGVGVFVAEINAENERILHFVRRSGLPAEKRWQDGVWEIHVRIT
jgi:RimJ/RimL family protein N-acetyltransferase